MRVVLEPDVKLAGCPEPFPYAVATLSPFQDWGRRGLQLQGEQGCVWPRSMQGDAVGRSPLIKRHKYLLPGWVQMVNGWGLGQPSPATMQQARHVKWCCRGEPAPVLFLPNVESSHTPGELLIGVPFPWFCNSKLCLAVPGAPRLEKAGGPNPHSH